MKIIKFAIFSCLLLAIFNARAQPVDITYLTTKEGLTSNSQWSVDGVDIDKNGFIWFVTNNGLNRYDGYEIKQFTTKSLGKNMIQVNTLTSIAVDDNNNIWLGTENNGIIKYDQNEESFYSISFTLNKKDSFVFRQINHLALSDNNELLISSAYQGFFRYNIKNDSLYRQAGGKNNNLVSTLRSTYVSDSVLVVLYNNAIAVLSNDTSSVTDYYFYNVADCYYELEVFSSDSFAIFSRRSSNKLIIDNKRKNSFKAKVDLEYHLSCAYQDDEGNKWYCNKYGQVAVVDSLNIVNRFFLYSKIDREKGLRIHSMKASKNGDIYFMSNDSGGGVIKKKKNYLNTLLEEPVSNIKLYNDTLYYSRLDSLFYFYDGQSKYIPLNVPFKNTVIANFEKETQNYFINYYSIIQSYFAHFDENGQLNKPASRSRLFNKILRIDSTLYVFSKVNDYKVGPVFFSYIGTLIEEITCEPFVDYYTPDFIETQNNEIWVGTLTDGIYIINKDRDRIRYIRSDKSKNGSLSSNNIKYLFEAKNGLVYIQTEKGINIYNPITKKIDILNAENGLDYSFIYSIGQGLDGNIYILTNDYIYRYEDDKKVLSKYNLVPPHKPKMRPATPLLVDSKGLIYYISEFGVSTFNPKIVKDEKGPQDVIITDFYLNRKPQKLSSFSKLNTSTQYPKQFILNYDNRNIGFGFVSIGGEKDNVDYFYKLEGYINEWQAKTKDRLIHYTNLDPGDYVFKVKARNGANKWTENVTSVSFIILPPWYATWWAYSSYFILTIILAYGFYKYRINQILKYQRLRIKISSDLHDDVGTLLTSIAMQSEILSIDQKDEKAIKLNKLSALSRKAMGRMRDTVWAIDARRDSFEDLNMRMRDYLNEVLEDSTFIYDFNIVGFDTQFKIPPDVRQNVYLIFKEAIANICKHSNGDKVIINIRRKKSNYILAIHDNGNSNSKDFIQKSSSGMGLSNMNMRAKRINGILSFDTSDGFEIKLKFRI